MKYTIVGDWYDCWDPTSAFAVVAEGEALDEAEQNAAEAVLEHFPHRGRGRGRGKS
ncbi:hypothetical protein [Streptomyces xantholiticus]|uniref:hypothetical protein n=1 Tax=Streptomyces xantholiticus TaxID=68285 RepID=UPI001676C8AE|nr:hypothetical protein [Streptomyces xantholiticus]GGW65393.1 hypothetical protein GCM10010381_57990 [Streptomyces xantholiticus]